MDKFIAFIRTWRAWPLALVFLLSFVVVAQLAPQKVGLAVWGLSKLAMGGYLGYWIDRWAFRSEARPHLHAGHAEMAAWLRRAVIVCAAILAAALIP